MIATSERAPGTATPAAAAMIGGLCSTRRYDAAEAWEAS
jgi:hypothetical protein